MDLYEELFCEKAKGHKAFFYTDDEGRVRFAGGPGSGGGGSGNGGVTGGSVEGNGKVEDFQFASESTTEKAQERLNNARAAVQSLNDAGIYNNVAIGSGVDYYTFYGKQTGVVEDITYHVGTLEFPVEISMRIRGADGVHNLGPYPLHAFALYNVKPEQ